MLDFVQQAMKNVRQTGAVLPSSPALAKVMTRTLCAAKGPKRLLEVGPGTGPFTKAMLDAIRPGDEFHIVEMNPSFCSRLEARLLGPYRRRHPLAEVHLHSCPIQEARLEGVFDFIVCGLPFNNFPPTLVRSIFRQLLSLLGPGGELVYFEYAGVRAMKAPLVGSRGRRDLRQIGTLAKALRRRHLGKRELVLGNIPPAFAVRLRRD
ncbi:MAG: methyltransferase domain-containing protein [Phycisphaerales bacterium]|nr:methyltransferase domain-containing protein [Phycisphaerales bacterium]